MKTKKQYSQTEILNTNPLVLAFVGDAVFTTKVRETLASAHSTNINSLSRMTSRVINAGNQYVLYRKIEPLLTDFEKDLCYRARNANIHTKAKNYSVTEYIYATAFEALVGYLYLTNQDDRFEEILKICLENL